MSLLANKSLSPEAMDDDYTNFYRNTNTTAYEHAMNVLMEHATKKDDGQLLDIGCDGTFSVDLLQQKFKETSSWQIKSWSNASGDKRSLHLQPNNIQELIQSDTIKKNSMDVIILYHVVYHFDIKQLKETLEAILSWLSYEGVLLITVIDDGNKFVEKIYRKISPDYALSTRIEGILKKNKSVQHCKDIDVNSIHLTFKEHLCILKSMALRDCLNQNYLPNGLGKEQLHEVDNKCIHFIKHDLPTLDVHHEDDGVIYENTFKTTNFIVKKESKKDAQKRYYVMIGTAILVGLITLL